jgi:hypothetical protein
VIGKDELFNLRMRSCSHRKAKQHKIKERERPYQLFYFKGKRVCRKAFCCIHNIEKKNVLSIARSLDWNCVSLGVHASTGKLPKYALQYVDTQRIKIVLLKYAADNALPLPERLPNYKTTKYYYCLLMKTLLTYIKNMNLWLLKCVTEALI